MSELLNLCQAVIEHAGDDAEAIAKAKETVEKLHTEGGLTEVAKDIAHEHVGELAVKLLMNIGIPFIGAELITMAIDHYNSKEEKDDPTV